MTMRKILTIALSIMASFIFVPQASALSFSDNVDPYISVQSITRVQSDQKITSLVNNRINIDRSMNRVGVLSESANLSQGAQKWSQYMATTRQYRHQGGYNEIIHKVGTTDSTTVAQVTVNGWRNSPAHNKIMMNPRYSVAGYGCTSGSDGYTYCVVRFI